MHGVFFWYVRCGLKLRSNEMIERQAFFHVRAECGYCHKGSAVIVVILRLFPAVAEYEVFSEGVMRKEVAREIQMYTSETPDPIEIDCL